MKSHYNETVFQDTLKGKAVSEKVILTLYVAGSTPRSERAIENIHRIVSDFLKGDCGIEVIDVLEEPGKAEDARILVTPTLVREEPRPERRIVGDLSDTEKVLKGLNIPGNRLMGQSG